MGLALEAVSACPECGAPIYRPESVLEKHSGKIKIVYTCHCDRVNVPDETIEPLRPYEMTEG